MAKADQDKFSCPGCGRTYKIKAELRGRKVKCSCGHVVRMPNMLSEPELGDGYELATAEDVVTTDNLATPTISGKCPQCNVVLKPNAVICINCGLDLRQGAPVKTVVTDEPLPDRDDARSLTDQSESNYLSRTSPIAKALEQRQYDQGSNPIADLYMPIAFIVLGIGLILTGSWLWTDTYHEAAVTAGFLIAGQLFIMVPFMLLALIIATKVVGVTFGPLFQGLFKITGLVLGPATVADFLFMIVAPYFSFGIMGIFALLFVMFLLYSFFMGIPMAKMFDLDTDEVMQTIWIIIMAKIFSGVLIGFTLYSLTM